VGLNETKTDDTDNIQIQGYVTYMKNRRKLSNTRSVGIMLLVKDECVKYVNIINTELWFRLSSLSEY
jgi:Tfp pilus assembly protein PilZ